MKGCAYYKLIVEKGDVTQAFKVPEANTEDVDATYLRYFDVQASW